MKTRPLTPSTYGARHAWGHWVSSGFKKASEIDFSGNGLCKVFRMKTKYGEIFCLFSKSGISIRQLREIITNLYKKSNEPVPVFATYRVFKRIEAIESDDG